GLKTGPATAAARTRTGAAVPESADRQPRVSPVASTIVSASTNSTPDASMVVRTSKIPLKLPPSFPRALPAPLIPLFAQEAPRFLSHERDAGIGQGLPRSGEGLAGVRPYGPFSLVP